MSSLQKRTHMRPRTWYASGTRNSDTQYARATCSGRKKPAPITAAKATVAAHAMPTTTENSDDSTMRFALIAVPPADLENMVW